MCQRGLENSGIYNIRVAGGLHPSDLLVLRWIGSLALCVPVAVFAALVVCIFRPTWIRPVLAGSVAIFLVYVLAFLFQAVLVITLNVLPARPQAGPRAEELQPLLGKTVREVASALHVPESALRPGDEPPGKFRFVSGSIPGEPLGRRLTIYLSRDATVFSPELKVSVADLLDKTAAGIAVSFPASDKRPDVVVGDVITYYHMQP
jgi:hypothetical protein